VVTLASNTSSSGRVPVAACQWRVLGDSRVGVVGSLERH
jgi:hypothetical protein